MLCMLLCMSALFIHKWSLQMPTRATQLTDVEVPATLTGGLKPYWGRDRLEPYPLGISGALSRSICLGAQPLKVRAKRELTLTRLRRGHPSLLGFVFLEG